MIDQYLYAPRPGPNGEAVKAWRWLMVMTKQEIHHRSQLAVYRSLMGIESTHLFSLGVEDLIANSVF